MAKWRRTTRIHTFLYRATRGLIGHRVGPIRMLLLTTTGRKSGVPRTLPLAYVPEGDEFIVLASNGGQEQPPLWWLNLEARPEAEVQVGSERFRARAHRAVDGERAQLWPMLAKANPMWSAYEKRTRREIPVVVLHRLDSR